MNIVTVAKHPGAQRPIFSYAAWLVDLDGTLYHPLPVKLCMAVELLLCGPWNIPLLKTFRHQHEEIRHATTLPGQTPWDLQLRQTALERNRSVSEVETVVTRWMLHKPGKWLWMFRRKRLLSAIDLFRRHGGRMALVSDYPAISKLKSLGSVHRFDVIVANGSETSPYQLKPAPVGYLEAASLLGIDPTECLVIGDRFEADGEAASRAEMDYLPIQEFE